MTEVAADLVAPPSFVPSGRFVELPGRGTTYIRELPGPVGAPTLVLLHGLSATGGLNWAYCFEPLAARYRVIAIDHRGHGHGIRTRRFRLADCADDVAALAEVLGLRQVTAVGYSMGGPIAQLLWYRHRSLVNGLVLCATARNFTSGSGRERGLLSMMPVISTGFRVAPGAARRAVVSRLVERRVEGVSDRDWVIDEFRSGDPATIAEAAGAIGRFTSREWIGAVDVPTAVVVTERDQLVPPIRQLKLAASIPGAHVVGVNGDHGVCARDPQTFIPALLRACELAAPPPLL